MSKKNGGKSDDVVGTGLIKFETQKREESRCAWQKASDCLKVPKRLVEVEQKKHTILFGARQLRVQEGDESDEALIDVTTNSNCARRQMTAKECAQRSRDQRCSERTMQKD